MVRLPESEHSLWREASPGQIYPSLKGDVFVDVVIVGAGITGLTAAYLLKRRGIRVAVLDKDTVGGGTTGRTTGKVTSQHSLAYAELEKSIGSQHAQIYAEANQTAVDMIEKIIKSEKIECDWERADNYVFTTKSDQINQFKLEAKIAKNFGLPAEYTIETPLPFEVKAAVKFTSQGKMTAQKYVLGLARAVHSDESYVFEHTNANHLYDGQPCIVHGKEGRVIAKHCIVATNVPTMPLMARGGYCFLEFPTESYIVAAPFSGTLDGMYISPDKRQYSILPVNFEDRQYILIGGEGHVSGLRISKKSRYERLAKYAQQHFGIKEFTHKWSDRDYLTYDKVPLIGPLYPWSKHMYVASAFKKWGLSNGTVAAMILTGMITGKENKWDATFSPQRLRPLKYIPKSVLEQAKQIW
jgi:glycine/D-amino acid oxidase-like deaminating enzyme